MTEKIALRVQHKRMTKEDWLKSDAILLEGEIGVESDTGYIKAGNGTDYFPDLPYLSGPPGIIVKGQFDYLEDLKNTYPTGNFGEGYQIKNEDKTVYAWGERHATKSASGSAITLEDSATANLRGLRLYGRSWQDGEPSIEEPKEIHSVENAVVSLCGKNIATLKNFSDGFTNFYYKERVLVNAGFAKGTQITVTMKVDVLETSAEVMTSNIGFAVNGLFMEQVLTYVMVKKGSNTVVLKATLPKFCKKLIIRPVALMKPGSCKYTVSDVQAVVNSDDIVFEEQKNKETLTIPYKLNAVPVDSGGNYTDSDGQQWIADYVDFDRGILVKNLDHLYYTAEEIQKWRTWKEPYPNAPMFLVSPYIEKDRYKFRYGNSYRNKCNNLIGSNAGYIPNSYTISTLNINIGSIYEDEKQAYEYFNKDFEFLLPLTKTETIFLSDSELQSYAKLHTLYPYTTVLNDQGAYMEVDYQSTEVEGEWLDVGKFHTNTNDVTQLQADMVLKANKRDLVDDVPRINELEGKIKELSSKIDRIVANGT